MTDADTAAREQARARQARDLALLAEENALLTAELATVRASRAYQTVRAASALVAAVRRAARLGRAAVRLALPGRHPIPWAELPDASGVPFQVVLKFPLPESVAVGRGQALWLMGWCYHPAGPVASVRLLRDGVPVDEPVRLIGRSNHQTHDHPPEPRAGQLDCAFLALLELPADLAPGTVRLTVEATLRDGSTHARDIGTIRLVPASAEAPIRAAADPPLIAVCMATYDPPPELFAKQVESIRRQTYPHWVCLINDDGTPPERLERLRAIVGPDPRFRFEQNPRRLGFYRNFERCLGRVPPEADFVALSDHDDQWHADKLATLLAACGPGVSLAYADMRIVTPDGRVLADSFWTERPNQWTDLEALLLANTVTGAASLFPRSLLGTILPFPPDVGTMFHDHWIAAVALARGEVRFIDRPLHDYVQHGANVIGHAGCLAPPRPSVLQRVREALRNLRPAVLKHTFLHNMAHHKAVYYFNVLRLRLMAKVLLLRCGDGLTPAKRLGAERVAGMGGTYRGLLGLAWRGRRRGGRRGVTIGAEAVLVKALLWGRWVPAASRAAERLRWALKPSACAAPRARADYSAAGLGRVRQLFTKVAPLKLRPDPAEPRRVNLLLPTIDFRYLFGGYITKLHLAQLLAHAGERVRLVIVDECNFRPDQWRRQCRGYPGLERFLDEVELAYAYDRNQELPVHPRDAFIATTWWTAHVAHQAGRVLGRPRFVYLIQEYETYTFPMGSYAALSDASYTFPHDAVFSTELLRDHFRSAGLGVFSAAGRAGGWQGLAFRNQITDVGPVAAADLARRATRRLLFYARPEGHAARNVYELGVMALATAAAEGVFGRGWELHGIGATEGTGQVRLGSGAVLELLPRQDQSTYADLLRAHDLGLALMYTPHPSLVPIEMASAGLVTVTNTCGVKTAEAIESISPNLIAAEPTVESVAAALVRAAARAEDFAGRAAGSRVDWPLRPEQAFPPATLARIREWLAPEGGAAREAA
jgi:glycosyltransferase involved in cell wall biosynthesis